MNCLNPGSFVSCGFPCDVFVHNCLVVFLTQGQFHHWVCSWTLSHQKCKCKSFFTVKEALNTQSKQDLVSQGSVSGIMPSYCALKWTWTFIKWLTLWTMSSLSHNEDIVGGADMLWKLCDKEECPKFKWLVKLLFVLCEKDLICWKTTKNFGWVSMRVSTELCIGLHWMNLSDSSFWQTS